MQWLRARRIAATLAIAALAPLIVGCGDDNGVDPALDLVGTWNATVLLVDGVDLIDEGMTLSFTFSADGEFSYNVTGDLLDFCDPGPDCSDGGDFTATISRFTLNPGLEQVVLSYSVTGNTLTVTGTVDGLVLAWTFQAA